MDCSWQTRIYTWWSFSFATKPNGLWELQYLLLNTQWQVNIFVACILENVQMKISRKFPLYCLLLLLFYIISIQGRKKSNVESTEFPDTTKESIHGGKFLISAYYWFDPNFLSIDTTTRWCRLKELGLNKETNGKILEEVWYWGKSI